MLEGIDEIARPLIAGSTVFANPRHEVGSMRLATRGHQERDEQNASPPRRTADSTVSVD
jgi:hypothetical protein